MFEFLHTSRIEIFLISHLLHNEKILKKKDNDLGLIKTKELVQITRVRVFDILELNFNTDILMSHNIDKNMSSITFTLK